MTDLMPTVPVIILDGLLASGSSILSVYVGRSYAFDVINGNQYLRELGVSTGFVTALQGTLEHELQLLDFYEHIATQRAVVHDRMYAFLTAKVRAATRPTVVHCTGYLSYAIKKQLPIKSTFWLHATLEDRVDRLLFRHQLKATAAQKVELKNRLADLDLQWEHSLKENLGISLDETAQQGAPHIDTSHLPAELAFQRLASIDSFIDAYNDMAKLLPSYHEEWRRWRCLVCQLVLETNKIVLQCPRCHNADPDKFKDLD